MDIYKLSGDELKITGMKQGVRNPDRVNVFVNGKYAFSLSVTQVVDFGIKVGMAVSRERLDELEKASEFGKLYQRALEWVLVRPRSEKEARDYLRKKVFEKKLNEEYIGDIIGRLRAKRYLDDGKFAEWYVRNRFVKKGVSRKRLALELAKKGVAKEVSEAVLGERNEEEEIEKMIAKKRAKYDDEKLMQYLCRQGFSYDLVREKVTATRDHS